MKLDIVVEHAHPLYDCDNDCRFCGRRLLNKFMMEAGGKVQLMTEIPEPKGLKRRGGDRDTEVDTEDAEPHIQSGKGTFSKRKLNNSPLLKYFLALI